MIIRLIDNHRATYVQGLTTAAPVWVVAATGVAAGLGLWRAGATPAGLALVVLTIGEPIDEARRRRFGRKVDD